MKNILAFARVQNGVVNNTDLEILTVGRMLAEALDVKLEVVLTGKEGVGAAGELAKRGPVSVYLADDPLLDKFVPDFYLSCLEAAVQQTDPGVILFCADSVGRDLAPRLAYRLNSALVTETIRFTVEGEDINWIRPMYGGNALAVMRAGQDRQIVTIRSHSFDPAEPAATEGTVIKLDVRLNEEKAATKVIDIIREVTEGVRLEDAKVVIAGGRGIGGAEGFKDLEALANLFGGAVGASRAATDAGWIAPTYQVGQTGKIVAPDLYIAIGISGASQHLAGISNAKNVVAINKDADAPIFQRANVGVVADYKTVLPIIIEKCQEILKQ